MLSWHFRPSLDAKRLRILVSPSATGLAGYAVVSFDPAPSGATARAHLVDLQLREDDRGLARRLIGAAYRAARERELPMLQVIGLDRFKRSVVLELGATRRTLPSWLYYYRALAPDLAAPLANPEVWDPSSYDGDASL